MSQTGMQYEAVCTEICLVLMEKLYGWIPPSLSSSAPVKVTWFGKTCQSLWFTQTSSHSISMSSIQDLTVFYQGLGWLENTREGLLGVLTCGIVSKSGNTLLLRSPLLRSKSLSHDPVHSSVPLSRPVSPITTGLIVLSDNSLHRREGGKKGWKRAEWVVC